MVRAITLLGILSFSTWAQSGPVRETSAPAIIGNSLAAFYNGYMYSCNPPHVVTLFAPDGHIALTLPIQGHGNGKVHVLAVAIDSDGTLAVAWQDSPSAGIDIRDSFGNLVRTMDAGRYVPAHLAFGEDHSLWSLGWQTDATKPLVPDRQDYMTVRKYSTDGKVAGAYLPRSLFPAGLEPGKDQWQEHRITVTGDRVGLEMDSGNAGNLREWVELDLNGNFSGRWKLDPSDGLYPGVALTSDGQAYTQRHEPSKPGQVFRLDRTSSTWQLVNAPSLQLYGADGDKVVFAESSDGDGVVHMGWYPQPNISFSKSTIGN